MKYPKIKFVVSPDEDIKNYIFFSRYSNSKFLKMFLPKDLHFLLKRNLSETSKEKTIKAYVKDKFRSRKIEIDKNTEEIKKGWRLVEKKYFDLISKIFKKHPWPNGKYIGFASVFDMYPRDVKEKTFYFSGLQKKLNFNLATIAHEMLHFMFFDYLKINYGIDEDSELKNKNPAYIWNISEVFNLIIETWKPYKAVFKTSGKPYDIAHARMLPKMRKLWKEKKDIDYLLSHYFECIT